MALKYFKYDTRYNNIIIDAQVDPFTGLQGFEAQVQINFDRIFEQTPWYKFRYDGSDIVNALSTQVNEFIQSTSELNESIVKSFTPPLDTSKTWRNLNDNELYFYDSNDWVTLEMKKIVFKRQGQVSNGEWLNLGALQLGFNRGFPVMNNIRVYDADVRSNNRAGNIWFYVGTQSNNSSALTNFPITTDRILKALPTIGTFDLSPTQFVGLRWQGQTNNSMVVSINYRKKHI